MGGKAKVSTLGPIVKAKGRRASFAAGLVLSGLVLVGCGGDEEAAEPTTAPAATQAPAAQTTPTKPATTATAPAGSAQASPVGSPAVGPAASPVASPAASPEASPAASMGGTSQGASAVPTSETVPPPPGA